jgi:hypothetical protein
MEREGKELLAMMLRWLAEKDPVEKKKLAERITHAVIDSQQEKDEYLEALVAGGSSRLGAT